MTVRVRIAPSPTGDPHVGTGYIALFNYAFAKKQGGKFVLRIEDTDQARSTAESEQAILDSLRWLGLDWDEGPDKGGDFGPYRQSERGEIYGKYVDQLIAGGHAYKCIRTQDELKALRSDDFKLKQARLYPEGYDPAVVDKAIADGAEHVVRLKTPSEGSIEIPDALRDKPIEIPWDQVDDQVLLKGDGFPTYHLANVVDDHLMEITHVIRGDEWISSTPKHLFLYECLGWAPPTFAHLPLLRNNDKSKVSKRKNPVSLSFYREAGYLPDAFVNFLGHMAFTFDDERDVFTLAEFVDEFSLEKVTLGGPVFDQQKLLWLNGRYIREKRSVEEFADYLQAQLFSPEYILQVAALTHERVEKSEDFVEYAGFFFKGSLEVEAEKLLIKDLAKKKTTKRYEELVERVDYLVDFTPENIEAMLRKFCEDKGLTPKQLFMPVRWMVTGQKATPPLFETMAVLGRERCRHRMRAAINTFKSFNPNKD